MDSSPDTVKDSSIKQGVGLKPVFTARPAFVEVISEVDGLSGVFRKIGDKYVRISSLTYAKLGLSTWIPRVINITPFATYYELKRSVESI